MFIVVSFYIFNVFFVMYSISCIKNPRKYPDNEIKRDIENGRKISTIRQSEELWYYGNNVMMKSWLIVSIVGIVLLTFIMPIVDDITDGCIIIMLFESVAPQIITGYKLWKKSKSQNG